MRNILLLFSLLISACLMAQKPLKITSKSYNDKNLVVDKKGKLYTGEAKEVLKTGFLKNDGYLIGKVNKGDISGVWEYHKKKKLQGYHVYRNNGDLTYSYNLDGYLNWIEYNDKSSNSMTEILVDKENQIQKLYIIDYKKDGSHKNTFEYEKLSGNYFNVTLADYDYNSLTVLDYFENDQGEQEIIIRDFDKHHELIKMILEKHHVKDIYFLGDLLENPEDAEYKLEKGFNSSFTNLLDKDHFTLSLLKGKDPVFEIIVNDGEIMKIDKRLNSESLMILYDKEDGYIPMEHQNATKLVEKVTLEINKLKSSK